MNRTRTRTTPLAGFTDGSAAASGGTISGLRPLGYVSSLDAGGGGGGGITLDRYEIAGISFDWLGCYKLDSAGARVIDATTGQPKYYYVARPRHLQRQTWLNTTSDGWRFQAMPSGVDPQQRRKIWVSAARITAGTDTWEIVSPAYHLGDVIYAASATTGVTVEGEGALTLLDLNLDGRKWGYPESTVKACVDGTTREIVLATGLPIALA